MDLDKKVIFMYILYVTLLIIMFTMVGLVVDTGSGDKKYAYTFMVISLALSLVCLFTIYKKSDKKSQTSRYVTVLSTLLMLGLLIGSLLISKPSIPQKVQVGTYVTITLVVLLNFWATWHFIGVESSQNKSE